MKQISKELFQFLEDLSQNNNREWFAEQKTEYNTHNKNIKLLFKDIEEKLKQYDDIESHKLMRIYRDIRFSKDKTPYKPRFAGSFKRATEYLRGGYFLNIEPGNSMVGGGFYGPNPTDLLRIRKEFEIDDTEIKEIVNNKVFKDTFGELKGEGVKTAPKGFSKDHPAINLIRKKQFYVMREFTDEEVMSKEFSNEVVKTYKILRPFFDYMSEVLTTNLNGESIIKD